MHNIYQPIEVVLEDIIIETPTIKTFVFVPQKDFSFATGQFVELTLPGIGEAPFTPSSEPYIKDRLEITIMRVGRVTTLLHNLERGAKLGLRGPYGKGYPLENFKGKDILIVGGGVGLAPLRSLIFSLFSRQKEFKRIVLCYGARTPEDIVYKGALSEWKERENFYLFITVDVGNAQWKGNVGLVTTLLKEDLPIDIKNTVAVVCGPPIMMKFTTLKLLDLGLLPKDIYLSMEKNMSCGLGKCGHCRIGKFYICKDGPVFRYEDLKDIPEIWD